jgi:Mg/Co/Ni transporter MgtE
MTTEPIVLRPDATVADALARVRNPDLSPALAAQVYVCRPPDETPTGKYLGTVHFQRLLRDPPYTLVSSILEGDLQALAPDAALPVVAGFFATYDMVAAPVVDESGSLLGAVTVDDVLDHMLPEDWRETEFHLHEDEPQDERLDEPQDGRLRELGDGREDDRGDEEDGAEDAREGVDEGGRDGT